MLLCSTPPDKEVRLILRQISVPATPGRLVLLYKSVKDMYVTIYVFDLVAQFQAIELIKFHCFVFQERVFEGNLDVGVFWLFQKLVLNIHSCSLCSVYTV